MLLHGDCLEQMKTIDSNSVDLIFCDLPYGQTSCKWDCKIDMTKFWDEIMRIKKLKTPLFFTTTTKFGNDLLNSAPKKCPFRYDLVWVKSAPAGFLCAKKMPMRKHEMVYVFYEKLPFYDLSSHRHKFIKEVKPADERELRESKYDTMYKTKSGSEKDVGVEYTEAYREKHGKKEYDPPLPVSVVKEEGCYGEKVSNSEAKYGQKCARQYDPPLPVSVIKEPEPEPEPEFCNFDVSKNVYGGGEAGRIKISKDKREHETRYDPPLPVSIVKEEEMRPTDTYKNESTIYGNLDRPDFKRKDGESMYDPPLPVSIVKEEGCYAEAGVSGAGTYKGEYYLENNMTANQGGQKYDPPLPVSVVKEPEPEPEPEPETKYISNDNMYRGGKGKPLGIRPSYNKDYDGKHAYDPPLPTTMLEIRSTRGKHSTEKPVALMEWIMKYYSKEGDVVLDPTMGSGSTGVACRNMNRNFIGIEMDPDIFEVAVNRIEG